MYKDVEVNNLLLRRESFGVPSLTIKDYEK